MINLQKMGTSLLIDEFKESISTFVIRQMTDDVPEDLKPLEARVDTIQEEIMRRMSW